MINLLIDLNNIAYRSMFIVGGYGTKQYTFNSQDEINQLVRKITTDITHIIRQINPSRVIFALDDKSWRKNISIEENDGYKSGRVKSKFINWDNVFVAISDFCDIAEKTGIIVTKIESAEADDVITLWTDELQFNQKQHVIIVSSDEDLRQLVRHFPYEIGKSAFSTVFNPFIQGKGSSKKLYVSKHFETWINETDEIDFMNMSGTININKEDFKKVITGEKTKYEVIDGNMIGIRKMFCGDDGDDVPPIYSWLEKDKNGNDKMVRITNSKFEKIFEMLKTSENEILDHIDIMERGAKVLEGIKLVSKHTPPFNIDDRIKRQATLVILDKTLFPIEIINDFEKHKQKQLQKPRINYSSINMYNLLEGSSYVKNKNENVVSFFKEVDRISGNLF